MTGDIHKFDTVVFERTVKDESAVVVNISTATTKEIIFVKPNKTKLTKAANFSSTGSDGKIRYTTTNTDLDISGVWSGQVHLILPTGEWRSDNFTFTVLENL